MELWASTGGWSSTDVLTRRSGFGPCPPDASDADAPRKDGLPAHMFCDWGKNGRRYVLGALKALYWLECVAWRHYSRQAIEWRWLGDRPPPAEYSHSRILEALGADLRPHDSPYLNPRFVSDDSRHEAAEARRDAFEGARQAWIETHHPQAAADYRQNVLQRQHRFKRGRKAQLLEAAQFDGTAGTERIPRSSDPVSS